MKDTSKALLCTLMISYLLFSPLIIDFTLAQQQGETMPVIAHRLVKMGQRGEQLNIIAHIASDSPIRKTLLRVQSGEKSIQGNIPALDRNKTVPVLIQVMRDSDIHAGPSPTKVVIARVSKGQRLYVTAIKNGLYRVHETGGFSGYINPQNIQTLMTGTRFGVAIPPDFTRASSLTYQIVAIDNQGRQSETPSQQVNLFTPQQIAALQSGQDIDMADMPQTAGSRPFYKKIWFWLLVFAGAGTAAYFATQGEDEPKETTVDVLVEWN
jgi:hypothetical protein